MTQKGDAVVHNTIVCVWCGVNEDFIIIQPRQSLSKKNIEKREPKKKKMSRAIPDGVGHVRRISQQNDPESTLHTHAHTHTLTHQGHAHTGAHTPLSVAHAGTTHTHSDTHTRAQ